MYFSDIPRLTMRQSVQKAKWIHDKNKIEDALKIVSSMPEQCGDANLEDVVGLVSLITPWICKMYICKKGCFENLDRAKWCRCSCGKTPPIKIRLDDEFPIAWA